MRRFLFLTLTSSLLAAGTAAAVEPALGAGEKLTYRVGWGLFFAAGEIEILAQPAPAPDGRRRLQVTTTTATSGFARALFTFDARADAIFDVHTGRIESEKETSKSSSRETGTSVTFDYEKSSVKYVNETEPAKSAVLPLPQGDPLDLIMSLVQTRSWNMKPGDQHDALVLFDHEFYDLTIHALDYEDVHTRLGTFKTLVLEPRMEKTPPKGMFAHGSGVRVWISQDERRLPVKFQVEFKFGSGVATLTQYEPPSPPPVAAAVTDAKNPGP